MYGVDDPLQRRLLTGLGLDARHVLHTSAQTPPSEAVARWLAARVDGVIFGPGAIGEALEPAVAEALQALCAAHVPTVVALRSPAEAQIIAGLGAGAREILDAEGPEAIFQARLSRVADELAVSAVIRRTEEVEAFISNASHDMKSPLRAISRYAGLILEDEAALSADARHMITRMEINADRLTELVEDLVRVVQVGRVDLREEPCPLREVLVVARRHLQDPIALAGATVEIGPGLPEIHGDFDRLVDVFENLIGNAVKYRRPGVQCWVSVEIAASEGGAAHVVIKDNGQGIAEEELEQIFGMFYRGDHRSIDGSGLGLAIVRRIVERHGGRIWAESVVGEGSTFHLRLPSERLVGEPPAPNAHREGDP